MKTKLQIEFKIAEHEAKIDELISEKGDMWNDVLVMRIEGYLQGRKALMWTLSNEELITVPDDYEKNVRHEINCYEASKIF